MTSCILCTWLPGSPTGEEAPRKVELTEYIRYEKLCPEHQAEYLAQMTSELLEDNWTLAKGKPQ